MADDENNAPEEYLPWGAENVDSEKSFWEPDLQPYIDERHKCIWALSELNNRYADKIIFELKAIKDFVQDWFRVPDRFYDFSRAMNNAVREAWRARDLALAASTEAKEAARLAEKFAMSEPVNNIPNYRGQTYLREDGVRVQHGYGVVRHVHGVFANEEFDEEDVEEGDILTYSGQFEDDKKSGRGIETCGNYIFVGSYSDGRTNGYGIYMTYEDNSRTGSAKVIHLGHRINSRISGPGVFIDEDKSTFSGNWKNFIRSGPGRLRYNECHYIDGNWIDGKIDGEGREVFENLVKEGKFKGSKMNGLCKERCLDGHLQIGEYRDNKLHGLGKQVYSDGRVHAGVFIDGKPCDQVANRYEGQTVNGQMCGRGKLFKADGSIEDGLWFEDKLVEVYHEPPIQVTSPDTTK